MAEETKAKLVSTIESMDAFKPGGRLEPPCMFKLKNLRQVLSVRAEGDKVVILASTSPSAVAMYERAKERETDYPERYAKWEEANIAGKPEGRYSLRPEEPPKDLEHPAAIVTVLKVGDECDPLEYGKWQVIGQVDDLVFLTELPGGGLFGI